MAVLYRLLWGQQSGGVQTERAKRGWKAGDQRGRTLMPADAAPMKGNRVAES